MDLFKRSRPDAAFKPVPALLDDRNALRPARPTTVPVIPGRTT